MKVLVDTCIWSAALRRRKGAGDQPARELGELVSELRVVMIGPVRQELLSGIRDRVQFERLRDHLRAFPDMELLPADYELAAEFFNTCRARGVQGSNTDFLICAAAVRGGLAIYTADADFIQFSQHLPLQLYEPRS